MTEDRTITMEYEGREYEMYVYKGKKPIQCEGCNHAIIRDSLYTESDAGEKYCEGCSTE